MLTKAPPMFETKPSRPWMVDRVETDREKVQAHTSPDFVGKSWLGYPLRCQKCHVAKTRLTTSPNSRAKAISHMGFVWETYFLFFFGSHNLWVSHVEAFAVLYGAFGTKCIGHRVCHAFVAVWYTLSWIEKALQLVWRDSTPNWILDGFKLQASTVSHWWTTREGGASTIELACGVKTLVLSHHQLLSANDCSKIE